MRSPPKAKPPRNDAGDLLSRKIRDEIQDQGRSAYSVATAAGVAPSIVQRLLSGHRADIRLSTASRIAAALGLRLVPAAGRRSPRAAKVCVPEPYISADAETVS